MTSKALKKAKIAKVVKIAKPKAAKIVAKPKANGSGRKPEGITAFMLSRLQASPITVKDLAEAAHEQFPKHPVPALTNTVRGVLATLKKRGMTAEHDKAAKTYQIAPVAK